MLVDGLSRDVERVAECEISAVIPSGRPRRATLDEPIVRCFLDTMDTVLREWVASQTGTIGRIILP